MSLNFMNLLVLFSYNCVSWDKKCFQTKAVLRRPCPIIIISANGWMKITRKENDSKVKWYRLQPMGIFCYRLLKIFLLLLPIANSIPQIHTYTAIILFTQKNFNTGTYLFINFNTISQAPIGLIVLWVIKIAAFLMG